MKRIKKRMEKSTENIFRKEKNPYRHELKYGIDYGVYVSLRQRLQSVMQLDSHARADKRYKISSIYFDNFHDKALREKINGAAEREKFRIRYYHDDFSLIKLEKKQKKQQLCIKQAAVLTETEYQKLLAGDTAWMLSHPAPLVRELYVKMKQSLLKPRVRVSYFREAYLYDPGNVRVTFDFDIRTSLFHPLGTQNEIVDIRAADTTQGIILEIKYDAFLPEIIAHLIQTAHIRQQAYSKYSISRRFG